MSDEARGHAIRRRRMAHGIKSQRMFSDQTTVDRQAIKKAEDGLGSAVTYERLEAWLDDLDVQTGVDVGPPPNDDMVEFHISGNFGVDVVVKGPVSDMAELESSVARLIREMRTTDQ